jgi:hypothetical protein
MIIGLVYDVGHEYTLDTYQDYPQKGMNRNHFIIKTSPSNVWIIIGEKSRQLKGIKNNSHALIHVYIKPSNEFCNVKKMTLYVHSEL